MVTSVSYFGQSAKRLRWNFLKMVKDLWDNMCSFGCTEILTNIMVKKQQILVIQSVISQSPRLCACECQSITHHIHSTPSLLLHLCLRLFISSRAQPLRWVHVSSSRPSVCSANLLLSCAMKQPSAVIWTGANQRKMVALVNNNANMELSGEIVGIEEWCTEAVCV